MKTKTEIQNRIKYLISELPGRTERGKVIIESEIRALEWALGKHS